MALSHLRQSHNSYEFLFSNIPDEDDIPADGRSCASDFTATCDIDLTPLSFLKSSNCEASLSTLSINSTPICFQRGENIEVYVNTPHELLTANTQIYPLKAKSLDKSPFLLETDDLCPRDKHEPITYLNKLVSANINQFILFRMTQIFFDSNQIFKPDAFTKAPFGSEAGCLTLNDLQLLSHYTDIASYARVICLRTLAEHIPSEPILPTSFPSDYSTLTQENETNLISSSTVLQSIDERNKNEDKKALPPIIDFSLFHGINLKTPSKKRNNLDIAINTAYIKILQLILININDLSPADKTFLAELQQSHLGMIRHAQAIRKIIKIEQIRLTQNADPRILQTNFLRLEIAPDQRTRFIINNSFLPHDTTNIDVTFPNLASYTLGTKMNDKVNITKISYMTNTGSENRARFTNNISNQNDKLFSPLKWSPMVLHILTDLLTETGIFHSSPLNTKNCHFNILYSEKVSEETLCSGFIFKCPNELNFHQILRPFQMLTRVKI